MDDYLKQRDLWWPVNKNVIAGYKDGSHSKETAAKSLEWRKNRKLHRDGDKPAWISPNDTLHWYQNGDPHRDGDKPALIWDDGTLEWFKNGKRHRDYDKPAWIGIDATLEWWKNGERHRVTGPAVINPNNKHRYWINGVEISKEVKSWLKEKKYWYPFTPEQQVEFLLTFG
jgi:hypothetical protein